MIRFLFYFISFFSLISCVKGDENTVLEPKLLSFFVQAYGSEIQCTINDEEAKVLIPDVKTGSDITDVKYTLSDNSTIFPDPKSRLFSWNREESFVITSADGKTKKYIAELVDFSEDISPEDTPSATIYTADIYGRVTKNFFYDIKDGSQLTDEEAIKFYQEEKLNGIRIPIYGNKKDDGSNRGHNEDGTVIEADYSKVVTSINKAKQYCPKLQVFASKKLTGDTSYADWLFTNGKLDADKYSDMLLSFLKYMKSQNIDINVLGVDNETNFNNGKITPDVFIEIITSLRNKINQEGNIIMPDFIGPERYNPQGFIPETWLYNLFNKFNGKNALDIYGTHYYPKHHYYSMNNKLRTEFDAISLEDKEFWATEPHWDNEELAKADLLGHARMAICALWDQTDLGMDAFMWWGYPLDDTDVRGSLMHDISTTIYGSQPVKMVDHDGEALLGDKDYTGKWKEDRQKPNNDPIFDENLHTRAFIKNGNEINVYIINVRYKVDMALGKGKSYEDYLIKIDGSIIDGEVEYRQWTDNSSLSGDTGTLIPTTDSMISLDIPLRSITKLSFKINTNL